jgi:hypothetical protein
MAAPTILTSDDVGAPTLSGEDGKLYDILKWALPLLGWSIEFDDSVNFRIVFRNDNADGGSGTYLRIVDKAADHASTAFQAQVNAYEAMTDIDTGDKKTPNSDASYITKSSAATSATRKYQIWGDKYRFILAVWADTDVNAQRILLHWFGDLVTLDPADLAFMMRVATATTSTPFTQHPLSHYFLTSVGLYFVRNKAGATGALGAHFFGFGPTSNVSTPYPGITGDTVDPSVGHPRFMRMLMGDGTQLRGWFPGAYLPLGGWIATYGSFVDVPDCTTPDGIHSLRLVAGNRSTSSNNSAPTPLLIDETDGWGDV